MFFDSRVRNNYYFRFHRPDSNVYLYFIHDYIDDYSRTKQQRKFKFIGAHTCHLHLAHRARFPTRINAGVYF